MLWLMDYLSFEIIDKSNSKFDLKIKTVLHTNWIKPDWNTQQNHLFLTLLLQPRSPLFSFFVLCYSFIYYFFIFVTLMIDIFYCVNNTSVLLHLFTRHFVSHLALSCITYSISALIINIFYCLDSIRLLLHLCIAQLVINFIITLSLTYVLGNYYDLYKYH